MFQKKIYMKKVTMSCQFDASLITPETSHLTLIRVKHIDFTKLYGIKDIVIKNFIGGDSVLFKDNSCVKLVDCYFKEIVINNCVLKLTLNTRVGTLIGVNVMLYSGGGDFNVVNNNSTGCCIVRHFAKKNTRVTH